MKIGGKELKDIIKDGVLDIKDNLKSLKVRGNSTVRQTVRQTNNVVGGDMVGGDMVGGTISSFEQNISGKNAKGVQITNSVQRVWINGFEVDSELAQGIREINVTGNVKTIDTQGAVNVGGDVTGGINTQGRVEVAGRVDGHVDTQGRVTCGDVTGNVNTMGKVECGKVGGNVDTMGKVIIGK